MTHFSNYWFNKVLSHLFSKKIYKPPTIYLGLLFEDPSIKTKKRIEPFCDKNYSRIRTSPADWNDSKWGELHNTKNLVFKPATKNWRTITHFGLFDKPRNGNLLAYGSVEEPQRVYRSWIVRFSACNLQIKLGY